MLFKLKPLLILLALCVVATCSYATEPQVQISLGKIKGSFMETALKKKIFAFRGIRFAKSTAGKRRFKLAEPVDPWSGVYDATKDGFSCSLYDPPEITSEDCLMLNVYTTKLPSANMKVKRPVIAFFHPSVQAFSSRSDRYGPQYLLDEDVVLVTVNSRLATFGYISTGDDRVPANLGLKDQVVALKWIQKHISAFGGDPNSVTLTGCSAGAVSTILHMLSPMSKGLFHRGFIASGAPETRFKSTTNETHILLAQAKLVDCPDNDVDKALACLKTAPRQKFVDTMYQFYQSHGVDIWMPVVEPNIPGVERFVVGQPNDLIRQGKFYSVPLAIGITKDELLGSVVPSYEAAVKGDDRVFRNWTENFDYLAPRSMLYERDTERSRNISHQIYKFYFNNEPITTKNAHKLGEMWSDSNINFISDRAARLLAEYSKTPVYNYMLTYQGRYSNAVWSDTKKPVGVVHMDDLLYYLTSLNAFPQFNTTDPEWPMVRKITSLLANFAKTGESIPKNNELFKGVTWEPFNPKTQNYLEMGEKFRTKYKMFANRFAFWERLFPLEPIGQ
ncbi:esterase FE4-like [Phymastichus coffea]|uniref:esterase FE4-like n=1 Tax=Phymastichus coffea TaxID=108790 RepID=UPI00273B6919|nr:esterase FE4-like [Phymastichus coffea]